MLELTQGLFGAADPEYLGDFSDPLASVTNTINTFEAYFDDLTAERRAHPTDDLATVIANGTVDGEPLGELERLWYYIIVATAGHDTTSFALSGGMEQLLRHPDQLRALQDDPDLAANATEEMIRWTSPVRSFFRWAQEDFELGGQRIAEGRRRAHLVPVGQPRRGGLRRPDDASTSAGPTPTSSCRSASACTTAWGPRWPAARCAPCSMKVLERVDTIELDGEPQWTGAHFVSGVKHLPVRYTLR